MNLFFRARGGCEEDSPWLVEPQIGWATDQCVSANNSVSRRDVGALRDLRSDYGGREMLRQGFQQTGRQFSGIKCERSHAGGETQMRMHDFWQGH